MIKKKKKRERERNRQLREVGLTNNNEEIKRGEVCSCRKTCCRVVWLRGVLDRPSF
jgi:hypothetical protein